MNTYLVPFDDDDTCDIFKVYANNWNDCENKIMTRYVNLLDSDELADIDDFNYIYTIIMIYLSEQYMKLKILNDKDSFRLR